MERDEEKTLEAFATVHDSLRFRVDGDTLEFGDGTVIKDVRLARDILWLRRRCAQAGVPISVEDAGNESFGDAF